MATEGDRKNVIRTTKVRTALKGDGSWISRHQNQEDSVDDDKPWVTEVRSGRLNSDFPDPISDGTPTTVSNKTVYTKTSKTSSAPFTNGYTGTSGFTKKSTDAYKKIAPHSLRVNVDNTEPSVSIEEQEKRKEAASKLVNNSEGKPRAYVLSAANKFESPPVTSASPATSFVAKRVVITDDEDSNYSLSKQSYSMEMSVDEPPNPKPKPVPTTKPSINEPVAASTSVAPVATLKKTPDSTTASSVTKPVTPAVPTTIEVPPSAPESKTNVKPKPVETTNALNDADLLGLNESSSSKPSDPILTPDLQTGSSLPKSSKTKGSLDMLAFDVIPIDTNTDKLSSSKTSTRVETRTMVQTKTDVMTDLKSPKPVQKTSALNDQDLLGLTQSSSQKSSDPVPSTDLLTGSSLPKSSKTKGSLDMLAFDVIPIDTNTDKLSSSKTSTRVETRTMMQTKTDVMTDLKSPKPVQKTSALNDQDLLGLAQSSPQKSSDPVPSTDLLTGSSLPKSSKTKGSLDMLAVDIIPIDTNTDKLRTSQTSSKVETRTVVETKTYVKSSSDPFDSIMMTSDIRKSPSELFDPLLSDSKKSQTVSVTYEQNSSDTKPWSKWSVPTASADENEGTEESAYGSSSSRTVYSSSRTEYSSSSTPEPESDSKKALVYVKSYVNSSVPARYDNITDYDYVTSSSSSYAYSAAPSVGMTACTYCSGMVGNDSKITIDHLNISCHPECFKCGICSKPMGDFIDSMFLHRGTVHCENCYANVI